MPLMTKPGPGEARTPCHGRNGQRTLKGRATPRPGWPVRMTRSRSQPSRTPGRTPGLGHRAGITPGRSRPGRGHRAGTTPGRSLPGRRTCRWRRPATTPSLGPHARTTAGTGHRDKTRAGPGRREGITPGLGRRDRGSRSPGRREEITPGRSRPGGGRRDGITPGHWRRDRASRSPGRREEITPGRSRPGGGRRDGTMSLGRLAAAAIRIRWPRAITATSCRLPNLEVAGRTRNRGPPGTRCLPSRGPGRITRGRLRRPSTPIRRTGTRPAVIPQRTPTTTGTGISARDSRRTRNPAQHPPSDRRRQARALLGQRSPDQARQHAAVTVGRAAASRQPGTRILTPGLPRMFQLSGWLGVRRPRLRSPPLRSPPSGHPPSRCRALR